jgi:hypothetical protein
MDRSDDLAIEGKAVAGSLAEIFAVAVTAAEVTCAGCGRNSPLADEEAYLRGPGSLLQCNHCASILGRLRRSKEALWVALNSSAAWQFQLPH